MTGGAPATYRTMVCVAIAVLGLAHVGCVRRSHRSAGLMSIKTSGELRVLVRPGFFRSRAITASGERQRVMIEHLAHRLGVRLRWVQTSRNDQLLDWLARGRGDLAVGRFAPGALRRLGFAASAAVDRVDDLVVAAPGSGLESLKDVATEPIDVQRSMLRWRFRDELPEAASGTPQVMFVPEETPLEEILKRVAGGRYRATLTDSGILDAFPDRYRLRVVTTLATRRPVVWAMRSQDIALKTAIDDFLFAENVLSPGKGTPSCRNLDEIRRLGVLRLITWNSPTTCWISSGGLAGFEYRLVANFARALRVRLELEIPPPGTDPLAMLNHGFGDLAALHQPLPPAVERTFPVTMTYGRVDLVLVISKDSSLLGLPEDLDGAPVAVDPLTARLLELMPFSKPPVLIRPRRGSTMVHSLMAVARGTAPMAVVDSDTARLELGDWPSLREGRVVMPGCELKWVIAAGAPGLRRAANAFLTAQRRSGLIRELKRYERIRLGTAGRQKVTIPPGHLTPFDGLLKVAGREYGIDWRLLASIMYEESQFNPRAVGPGGSAGLFQFMPTTWPELGVHDPMDPREAIPAAARYLKQLMDQFPGVVLASRVAMAIASYNVGPRHVADARKLAVALDLDPDVWSGNVETAMLILDNPDVASRFPAGVCRCRRAVGYTRRILRRYEAYREEFSVLGSAGL